MRPHVETGIGRESAEKPAPQTLCRFLYDHGMDSEGLRNVHFRSIAESDFAEILVMDLGEFSRAHRTVYGILRKQASEKVEAATVPEVPPATDERHTHKNSPRKQLTSETVEAEGAAEPPAIKHRKKQTRRTVKSMLNTTNAAPEASKTSPMEGILAHARTVLGRGEKPKSLVAQAGLRDYRMHRNVVLSTVYNLVSGELSGEYTFDRLVEIEAGGTPCDEATVFLLQAAIDYASKSKGVLQESFEAPDSKKPAVPPAADAGASAPKPSASSAEPPKPKHYTEAKSFEELVEFSGFTGAEILRATTLPPKNADKIAHDPSACTPEILRSLMTIVGRLKGEELLQKTEPASEPEKVAPIPPPSGKEILTILKRGQISPRELAARFKEQARTVLAKILNGEVQPSPDQWERISRKISDILEERSRVVVEPRPVAGRDRPLKDIPPEQALHQRLKEQEMAARRIVKKKTPKEEETAEQE